MTLFIILSICAIILLLIFSYGLYKLIQARRDIIDSELVLDKLDKESGAYSYLLEKIKEAKKAYEDMKVIVWFTGGIALIYILWAFGMIIVL